MSLHDIRYQDGELRFRSHHDRAGEEAFGTYFEEAERILARAQSEIQSLPVEPVALEPDFETMRWFPLAHEVMDRLVAVSSG